MCSAPFRVRFDEAGADGILRTSVLLRYAQDLAWLHSANRGFDRAWYSERRLTWLVRTAEVAVEAPIAVGSDIVGTTQVVGWRRVWARRATGFRDSAGNLLATAQIDWVLLDAGGAPTRIPPAFEPVFGAPIGVFGLARVDVGEPPREARLLEFTVRPHELDPLGHVNNAVYVDWLEEAVIAAGDVDGTRAIPRLVRLEYVAAADVGAVLAADLWPAAGGWNYRLRDGSRKPVLRARIEPGRLHRQAHLETPART